MGFDKEKTALNDVSFDNMKRTNAGRKLLPVARMNQKVAY